MVLLQACQRLEYKVCSWSGKKTTDAMNSEVFPEKHVFGIKSKPLRNFGIFDLRNSAKSFLVFKSEQNRISLTRRGAVIFF